MNPSPQAREEYWTVEGAALSKLHVSITCDSGGVVVTKNPNGGCKVRVRDGQTDGWTDGHIMITMVSPVELQIYYNSAKYIILNKTIILKVHVYLHLINETMSYESS